MINIGHVNSRKPMVSLVRTRKSILAFITTDSKSAMQYFGGHRAKFRNDLCRIHTAYSSYCSSFVNNLGEDLKSVSDESLTKTRTIFDKNSFRKATSDSDDLVMRKINLKIHCQNPMSRYFSTDMNSNSGFRGKATVSEGRFNIENATHSSHGVENNLDGEESSETGAERRKTQMKNAAEKGTKAMKKGATSLRDLVKTYGWTFVGTYFTVYIITLSTLFAGIDSGYIDPASLNNIHLPWFISGTGIEEEAAAAAATEADAREAKSTVQMISDYMKKWEVTKPYSDMVIKNPHVSNLAIAWVATKLTEPVRVPLTLALVPRVARFLGQAPSKIDKKKDSRREKRKNSLQSEEFRSRER